MRMTKPAKKFLEARSTILYNFIDDFPKHDLVAFVLKFPVFYFYFECIRNTDTSMATQFYMNRMCKKIFDQFNGFAKLSLDNKEFAPKNDLLR